MLFLSRSPHTARCFLRSRRPFPRSDLSSSSCTSPGRRLLCESRRQASSVPGASGSELAVPGDTICVFGEEVTIPEKYDGLSVAEVTRRLKISLKNKGKKPWNTGKNLSPEHREVIRQRVAEAMKRPEVREKCEAEYRSRGPLSSRQKDKISMGVKMAIRRKKYSIMVGHFMGEVDYPARKRIKPKKRPSRARKRAKYGPRDGRLRYWRPKSPLQRQKIAESIRLKWMDPEYRRKQENASRSPSRSKGIEVPYWVYKSGDKFKPNLRESAYLKVVVFIKKLLKTIEELELKKELLASNDVEGASQIDQSLKEARAVANKELEGIRVAHREMGSKLGVDLDIDTLTEQTAHARIKS